MYIDTHTHLNSPKLFSKAWKILSQFENMWWTKLLNVWVDENYNQRAIDLVDKYDTNIDVKASIWYHPSEVVFGKITKDNLSNKMDALEKLYNTNKSKIVAIWECGIDRHYTKDDKIKLQQTLLNNQAQLARKFDVPIIVHSRDGFQETIDILNDFRDLKVYFHCRGYGVKQIETVQDIFDKVWIGFAGNLTYPKADKLDNSLMKVKLNSLFLETDAPYLAPQAKRWKQNSPVYIKYLYEYVAKKLDISLIDLQSQISNNFDKFLL